MRNQLIKTTIKPFFKNEGFENKGACFYKDFGFFQVEADIQSRRYHVDKATQNFRINYELFCDEFTQAYGLKAAFGGGSITQQNSWINLNPKTNLVEITHWLLNELSLMIKRINEWQNPDYLIELWSNYGTDLQCPFLLKKFKPCKFPLWQMQMAERIKSNEEKLNILLAEKETLLNSTDCLDKEMRLNGINMQIKSANEEIEKTNRIINLVR